MKKIMLETRVEVNHRLHHTSVKLPNGMTELVVKCGE
jgi:hypothetical protein